MEGLSNAYNKIFISFSGGKDSVASYLKCIEHYPKEIVELIFCDTGDELPETYEYIKYFDEKVHPVTRLAEKVVSISENRRRSKKTYKIPVDKDVQYIRDNFLTVFDEIRYRFESRPDAPPFPANGKRHCTELLKVKVFNKYVRNKVPRNERELALTVIGLRQQESHNRAKTQEYAIDPINNWDIWYPIYDFSIDDVLRLHKENNVKVNPSYILMKRSNCVGCPFGNLNDVKRVVEKHGVGIISEWIKLEEEVGYTYKSNHSILDYEEFDSDEQLYVRDSCTSGFCEF